MSDSRLLTVAREDFRRVRRSRLLWGAFALVVLLTVPSFWSTTGNLLAGVEGKPAPAVQAVLNVPAYLLTYLFVLVAALAYRAVASERQSGTVRFLLGLPATRRDVLGGKLLARTATLAVVLAPLLALFGAIVVVQRGTLPVLAFLLAAGWTLVFGALWTAFTVGLSAAFDSQYRALAAVAGTYIVLAFNAPVWKAVLEPALTTVVPREFAQALNPTLTLAVTAEWLVSLVTPATSEVGAAGALASAASLALLAAAGLSVGYLRFERADLG